MGRMKELHMELIERGLTDEQIENRNLADLNFDDAESHHDSEWFAHQDVSNFADDYQAACLKADIDDWRIAGVL